MRVFWFWLVCKFYSIFSNFSYAIPPGCRSSCDADERRPSSAKGVSCNRVDSTSPSSKAEISQSLHLRMEVTVISMVFMKLAKKWELFRLPTQSASVNNAVSTFLLEPKYTMYESNVQHKSTRVQQVSSLQYLIKIPPAQASVIARPGKLRVDLSK